MKRIPLEPKDLSVLKALKPFLSPRGQELVDMVTAISSVFNSQGEAGFDPEVLVNLVKLLRQEGIIPFGADTS